MQTDNKKNQISVSEVARTLGWALTTAYSIKARKSPADKYEKILKCEEKLLKARKEVEKEINNI